MRVFPWVLSAVALGCLALYVWMPQISQLVAAVLLFFLATLAWVAGAKYTAQYKNTELKELLQEYAEIKTAFETLNKSQLAVATKINRAEEKIERISQGLPVPKRGVVRGKP